MIAALLFYLKGVFTILGFVILWFVFDDYLTVPPEDKGRAPEK